MIVFYNRDEKYLQRGTDWVFKSARYSFAHKGLMSYDVTHTQTLTHKHTHTQLLVNYGNFMYYIFLLVPTAYSVALGDNGFPPLSLSVFMCWQLRLHATRRIRGQGPSCKTKGYSWISRADFSPIFPFIFRIRTIVTKFFFFLSWCSGLYKRKHEIIVMDKSGNNGLRKL